MSDTLSDVLNLMRFSGCVYFLRDFAPPWGMRMPDGPFAQFHMVVRGQCWLRSKQTRRLLSSGDIVILPHGTAHELLDDPATVPVPGPSVLAAHRNGRPLFQDGHGDAPSVRLLCGHFAFDRDFKHPLAAELPELIHIRDMTGDQPDWFEAATRLLIRESDADLPGAATVVDRLAEVLFIQVLRAHLLQTRPTRGFLAAICDPHLGRALHKIHAEATRDLTLAEIARAAGMSRSNLAFRFKTLVGETPITYLTRWRLLQAQELLRTSTRSLPDIAHQVGYRSQAAFSRAFKRTFAQSPGTYRRTMRPAE